MPTAEKRSKREIELTEKKLESEIKLLDLEAEKTALERDEYARDERDALAKASEARTYNFVEGVGPSSVKNAIIVLNEWARKSKRPITIVYNTPGGGVFEGLALYDAIEAIKAQNIKVTTVVRGMAASMGGILLQSGDERIIGKNAYVLIHEVSDVAMGTTSELEDELKLTKRLQARLVGILASRSTLTAKQIEHKWKKTDWWLDADEAVELGFADKIG